MKKQYGPHDYLDALNEFHEQRGGGKVPPSVRWGSRTTLQFPNADGNNTDKTRATFVSTPVFPHPRPIAFQFGFSLDGGNVFAAPLPGSLPATASAVVTIRKSIDPRSQEVIDTIILQPGEIMPLCEVLARQLTISVQLLDSAATTPPNTLQVEVTAAPVDAIDCRSLSGGFNGYLEAESAGINNPGPGGGTFIILPPRARRAQFVIVNHSALDLQVRFGGTLATPILWTPFPDGTLILPGSSSGVETYESPIGGFTGRVLGRYVSNTTTADTVLVTEGLYPVS